MSPSATGSGASRSCSLLSGVVFIAEVDEIVDTWSGDTTTVNVETLLVSFGRIGTVLLNCQSIRISRVLASGLKELCLCLSVCIMVTDINMPG